MMMDRAMGDGVGKRTPPITPTAQGKRTPPTTPTAADRERVARTSKLLWHAKENDLEQLKKLLRDHPDLATACDYDGRTALHVAACYGRTDAARLLLEAGAIVNAQDRWGTSPLGDAEQTGNSQMIRLLKDYGGELLGTRGSKREGSGPSVGPLLIQKSYWEIDPSEIDLNTSILIGKGSFGEIRKVTWRGTPVAVKTILPSLVKDRLVVQDFIHEVDLLVKLRHPNIVQFLGAVTKRPPLMLVTEFLSGGDLNQFLQSKGALQLSQAISSALDIARGMAYLHNGPNVIIHRDLKPRNVLLDEANQMKVGDFGLSKLITKHHHQDIYKLTGETGSYRYMAPEVFRHESYDKNVDIFSFAMILYEMLEGYPPFPYSEPYEAARLVADDERRPTFSVKNCPQEMIELIEQCWATKAASRPSFVDIIKRLEQMEATLPPEPRHWRFLHHS
ncbi:hypothetical protein O6H91_09G110900 [Diphasiastrum complanatum]|uniref:Uncharacterized protein n=1 Tax=Diphasiastrum complanatum TaxID=34168 RepID=A0ACC2CT61_DIPCM|nr:hypothetical protein O6H91_09G110900 [Diphasiastrum complanatum]